jgi:hypothetical protein
LKIRLSNGNSIFLSRKEIGHPLFQLGTKLARVGLNSKSLERGGSEQDMRQLGLAFQIGWWTRNSIFYGEGVSVPFQEEDIRLALSWIEPEKSESD